MTGGAPAAGGGATVRAMRLDDVAATAALVQEMQAHYRVPCPPADEIAAALRALPDGVAILVAVDGSVLGFAATGAIFPGPGLRPGLFLKELFVAAGARGRGIGRLLMREVARMAAEGGFARVDWTADRGDAALRRFYGSLGAAEQSEKVFFRLAGPALHELAASDARPGSGRPAA